MCYTSFFKVRSRRDLRSAPDSQMIRPVRPKLVCKVVHGPAPARARDLSTFVRGNGLPVWLARPAVSAMGRYGAGMGRYGPVWAARCATWFTAPRPLARGSWGRLARQTGGLIGPLGPLGPLWADMGRGGPLWAAMGCYAPLGAAGGRTRPLRCRGDWRAHSPAKNLYHHLHDGVPRTPE